LHTPNHASRHHYPGTGSDQRTHGWSMPLRRHSLCTRGPVPKPPYLPNGSGWRTLATVAYLAATSVAPLTAQEHLSIPCKPDHISKLPLPHTCSDLHTCWDHLLWVLSQCSPCNRDHASAKLPQHTRNVTRTSSSLLHLFEGPVALAAAATPDCSPPHCDSCRRWR